MSDVKPVHRALISVSDKDGIVAFAEKLSALGVELISTGGTASLLAENGLSVKDVSDLTGFPEMMDGRVKTLHPMVHGGLLAIRDNQDHQAAMQAHDIAPIDLLVVNLYPFAATVAGGGDYAACVENIDIGGPAMIRAAAKNHEDVAVLVDGDDYDAVLAALAEGGTTQALRRRLAQKAYARTAAYDAAISNWMAAELDIDMPPYRAFGGKLNQALRYGENPHQQAGFYAGDRARKGWRPRGKSKERRCLSIILMTRMRLLNWSVSSTVRLLPAPLSNTQIHVGSRWATRRLMLLPKRCAATRFRLLAALSP